MCGGADVFYWFCFLSALPNVKLHLPYFNLADGARSTDASLLLEIIMLDNSSEHGDSVSHPSDDDDHFGPSSSLGLPQMAEARQQGGRVVAAPPNASSMALLAVATLDVQTALVTKHSRNSATAEKSVPFTVAKKKGAAGTAFLPCHELPHSIPVSVELTFNKATSSATAAGEQRVEPTIQRAGNDDTAVPAFFVVLTTLFDCATAMNGAELRLYTRCGDTGAVSKVSSGGRGAIGEPLLVFAT